MVDWNAITGEILTQILKVIVPIVVVLIIKWGVEIFCRIRETSPDFATILKYAVENAVLAAEQLYGPGGTGEEKKQYAINAVEMFLAEKGLSIDLDVIIDSIEAAVYAMNRENFFFHAERTCPPENCRAQEEQEEIVEEDPES